MTDFYADLTGCSRRRDTYYGPPLDRWITVYSTPAPGRVKVLPWYDESTFPAREAVRWRAVVVAKEEEEDPQ